MLNTFKNYLKQHIFPSQIIERKAVEAYDIWSENYDRQPGNLMLDLDEIIFSQLLKKMNPTNKLVADIGCGTGRHWAQIFNAKPLKLTGFDVSGGMLDQLQKKFPEAQTHKITDDLLMDIPAHSFDMVISTLTVAHIKNIEEALNAWCRILKGKAEILITDFHPKMLAFGGKRTFLHHNKHIAVQNFVHHIAHIKETLEAHNFSIVAQEEIRMDESVRHYYASQNALHVYESYKGFPIIYGILLRRNDDFE